MMKFFSQLRSKNGSCSLSKEHLFKPWGEIEYKVKMLKKKKRNLINLDYKANCLKHLPAANYKGNIYVNPFTHL